MALEGSRLAPDCEECFLCHIIRIIAADCPPQEHPHCLLVPIHQQIERVPGSVADRGEQCCVILIHLFSLGDHCHKCGKQEPGSADAEEGERCGRGNGYPGLDVMTLGPGTNPPGDTGHEQHAEEHHQ
jgi:hypothetical protein